MMMRACKKCGIKRPYVDFYKDKGHKNGLTSYCKICIKKINRKYAKTENGKKASNKAAKKYQKTEKGKKTLQKYHKQRKHKNCVLKSKFGITLEQYDKMFEEQNGVCAICGQVDITGRRLAVDHDHGTNKVRGLLCTRCNTRLGILEHEIWRPLAEKYLKSSLENE